MKASRIAWIGVAALVVAVLLWKDSLGQAPVASVAPAAPGSLGTVAVIDVERVLLNYPKAIDKRNELEKRRQQLATEDDARQKAIQQIEASLQALTPDSPEYTKQVNEMRRLAINREAELKFETLLLQAEHHRLLRALYEEVAKMAGVIAKENGFKVVLYWDKQLPKSNNSQELTAILRDRKVVYADDSEDPRSPGVDITTKVLQRLKDLDRATATTRP